MINYQNQVIINDTEELDMTKICSNTHTHTHTHTHAHTHTPHTHHTHSLTNTHTHTHTHTHNSFSILVRTFIDFYCFYTDQTIFSIALNLNLALTGDF